jgi:zinc protease
MPRHRSGVASNWTVASWLRVGPARATGIIATAFGVVLAPMPIAGRAASSAGFPVRAPTPANRPGAVGGRAFVPPAVDDRSRVLKGPSLDSTTMDYVVSGVHVIQRLTPASDVVAVELFLQGGVQQLTAKTAGIEVLALGASLYGTDRYPGTNSRRAFARTGSEWLLDPSSDWTMVGFRGVTDQFDSAWSVFADRITHPTLDSVSIALVRQRMMHDAAVRRLTPEDIAYQIADSLTFAGHPYALTPRGTETSLAGITPAAVRRYAADEFVTSRLLLVVAGNIRRTQLEPLVAVTLGTLPAGSYVWSPPAVITRRPSTMVLVQRNLPANCILGYFVGPSVLSPDYPAFELATRAFSGGVEFSVGHRSRLSSGVHAAFVDRAITAGGVYASTTVPIEVFKAVQHQLGLIKQNGVPKLALDPFVKQVIYQWMMQTEGNEAQASALARAQLLQGDYHKARDRIEALRHVSDEQLARAAQTYIRDIQFVYIGDTTQVRRDWVNAM